jgi:Tfp pilus assembly protein PilO
MEKLKQLPVYWQLLILLVVAAGLYYGFYSFVTSPIYAEAKTVQEQADGLQRKNEQARIATQNIDKLRELFAAKTVEYDELKVLLPEEREITRFSPRDDSVQGFITAKPVEIEVGSNFSNLKTFYEQMAKLPRIVSITDFKINQRPKQMAGKTIDAQFLLTAYYATSETAKAQYDKEQAAKNAKNKPAAKPSASPAASPAK